MNDFIRQSFWCDSRRELFALILSVILGMGMVLCRYGIYPFYETGDDLQLSMILNGHMWGVPPLSDPLQVGTRIGTIVHFFNEWGGESINWYLLIPYGLQMWLSCLLISEVYKQSSHLRCLKVVLLSFFLSEMLLRYQCTQFCVLAAVLSFYFFIKNKNGWFCDLCLLLAMTYALVFRYNISLFALVFLLFVVLVNGEKVSRNKCILLLVLLGLIYFDQLLISQDSYLRIKFSEFIHPMRRIFDFSTIASEDFLAFGMTVNDLNMIKNFMIFGDLYEQLLFLSQGIPEDYSVLDVTKLLYAPLTQTTNYAALHWFLNKFVIGSSCIVVILGFFVLDIFSLKKYIDKFRLVIVVFALFYVGFSFLFTFKLVSRFWDPLAVVVVISTLFDRHHVEVRNIKYVALSFLMATVVLVFASANLSNRRNLNFSSIIEKDISNISSEGIFVFTEMPYDRLNFLNSEQVFGDKRIVFWDWLNKSPLKEHLNVDFGYHDLEEALLERDDVFISLNNTRREILKRYYLENRGVDITFRSVVKMTTVPDVYKIDYCIKNEH